MSSRPNIDDLFKNELNGQPHEFSESLWQKLDAQLQPERDAYHKKDRKRRALWLSLLLLVAVGGGTAWYLAGNNISGKQIAATEQKGNSNKTVTQPPIANAHSEQENNNNNQTKTVVAPPSANNVPATPNTKALVEQENGITATPAENEATIRNEADVIENHTPVTGVSGKKNTQDNNKISHNNRKTSPLPLTYNNKQNVQVGVSTKEDKKNETPPVEMVKGKEENTNSVRAAAEEASKVPEKTPEEKVGDIKEGEKPVVIAATPTEQPVPAKLAAVKPAPAKTPLGKSGFTFSAGTNISSPFRKTGVYGGVLFTKTIGDKHIFAGIKMAGNRLHHELVFASKQGQVAPVTDAIIEKLTILQVPFGYEFAVSRKGNKNKTFLFTGFEPAYITGLRTLFYDDFGVPGGPRQEVVNSPLMSKAVNRFSLSFIAGVRKQVTPRIGLSLTGGYSLIDITNKQYYNRTSANNNLKYLQAGLLFRLNK